MAMANMNLIGVFVTKLWPVQALGCGGGGGDGDGGTTKNIISPIFLISGILLTLSLLDYVIGAANIGHRLEIYPQ